MVSFYGNAWHNNERHYMPLHVDDDDDDLDGEPVII